jgi:hypothetical protein
MADETKDGPASEPGPPKMATEGARAETGAAKTDAATLAASVTRASLSLNRVLRHLLAA